MRNDNQIRWKTTLLSAALALALAGGSAFAGKAQDEQGKLRAQATEMADETALAVSNARKEATLWTAYAFNEHLSAFAIDVEVQGERAILTGQVESTVEKDLAAAIAEDVDGIKQVDNRLQIDGRRPVASTDGERDFRTAVADATLTARVKSRLLWNDHTDGLDINVDSYRGKVSLRGVADSQASRDLAGHLAADTEGVIAVDNGLEVDTALAADTNEQPVADAWITSKVKSSLLYSRSVDGLSIDVDTENGAVMLTGTVDSGAERELAIRLAKDIRGVNSVDASELKVG